MSGFIVSSIGNTHCHKTWHWSVVAIWYTAMGVNASLCITSKYRPLFAWSKKSCCIWHVHHWLDPLVLPHFPIWRHQDMDIYLAKLSNRLNIVSKLLLTIPPKWASNSAFSRLWRQLLGAGFRWLGYKLRLMKNILMMLPYLTYDKHSSRRIGHTVI